MISLPTKQQFVWGWLRLALGLLQTGLVTVAAISLYQFGLADETWVLVIAACAVTATSRCLYGGRSGPRD